MLCVSKLYSLTSLLPGEFPKEWQTNFLSLLRAMRPSLPILQQQRHISAVSTTPFIAAALDDGLRRATVCDAELPRTDRWQSSSANTSL